MLEVVICPWGWGVNLVGWLLGLEPKKTFSRPLKAFAT